MKFLFLFAILLLGCLSYCQMKPLPAKVIQNTEQKGLFCFDSNGKKTTVCPLSLDGFEVEFYKASINKETSEIRLIGRLTPSQANVGIFLSDNDSISLKTPISRTSYDKENLNNDGFFDVTIKVKSGVNLYFYERQFFAKQFDISIILILLDRKSQ